MVDNSKEQDQDKEKPEELLTSPSHEELILKLNEAEEKLNQHWERILRMQAENENVLRRAEREVASARKYALENFITALLPVVDSLELCVANVSPDHSEITNAVIEGVNLTLKMFYTVFEKHGVKQINPISEPFDPEFQQAISMQDDNSVKPGTVISVMQKGYTLNNRLLRPALVIVSQSRG